jgi:hypothetical protein
VGSTRHKIEAAKERKKRIKAMNKVLEPGKPKSRKPMVRMPSIVAMVLQSMGRGKRGR